MIVECDLPLLKVITFKLNFHERSRCFGSFLIMSHFITVKMYLILFTGTSLMIFI